MFLEGIASSRCAQGTDEVCTSVVRAFCINRLTQHMQLVIAEGLHFSAFHILLIESRRMN